MDNKVTYKIDAIDKITPVYRTLIGLQNKAARSVTQTNSGINEANRSMNQLANTTASAGVKISNATKYGVLRFQRVKKTVDDTEKSVKKTGSSLDWLRGRVQGVERRATMMGNRFTGALTSISNKLGGIGTAMAGVFTLDLMKTAYDGLVTKASDYNEVVTKTQTIFGNNGFKDIEKFASTADKALGLSKTQAMESAAGFGGLFKTIGMAPGQISGASTKLVQLAADMASFDNVPIQETLDALSSGLRGEMEPLSRFRVMLNESTLKQEAFSMGLIKSTKEALTPQQKVMATLNAVYKQTKDSQGDFAKTSAGLAGQTKTLASEQANLQTELGQVLLPIQLKYVSVMRSAVEWVSKNTASVWGWAKSALYVSGALLGVYAAARTIIGVADYYKTVKDAMLILRNTTLYNAIAQRIAAASTMIHTLATSGLARAMVLARIKTIAFNIVAAVSPFAWIGLVIGGIILLVKHWDKVKIYLAKFAAWVWENHPFKWMIDLIDRVFPGFKNNLAAMFESIKTVFLNVVGWIYDNVLKPLFGWLGDLVDGFSFDAKPTIEPQVKGRGSMSGFADRNKKDTGGGLFDLPVDPLAKDPTKKDPTIKDSMNSLVSGGGKEMKNINIRIDKLIESFTVSTETFGLSANQIKSEVQKILLSAVNEVNYQ